MGKHKKKENIIEKPIIEKVVVKSVIKKEKEILCPKCKTPMEQHGGGPLGYSDFKCPACGAGLSKVI